MRRKFISAGEAGVRGPLLLAARLAIWLAVGLLLVRGAKAVMASSAVSEESPPLITSGDDRATDAFAIRFARLYLADPSAAALGSMLAPGSSLGGGGAPAPRPLALEQVTVASSREVVAGRSIVTVACELAGGEVRYLAIPLLQDARGRVAALGLPGLVPGPRPSPLEAERTEPLAGPEAEDIAALVERFLPSFITAQSAAEYGYLLAPSAWIAPLGGSFIPLGTPTVRQFGGGEGPYRRVLATMRLRGTDGGVYPVSYRLDLVRRERWYVAALEGESR